MQPYSYLASYFRGTGHDDRARQVMLAAQRAHRRTRPWLLRLPGLLMDAIAGYGYAPGRAVTVLIGAWALGYWHFDVNNVDDPALYAADLDHSHRAVRPRGRWRKADGRRRGGAHLHRMGIVDRRAARCNQVVGSQLARLVAIVPFHVLEIRNDRPSGPGTSLDRRRPRPRLPGRAARPVGRPGHGPSSADRFAGPLTFGTAGLRGPLRAGPNGMNLAVVRQAAAGLVRLAGQRGARSARLIGYDARRGSHAFATETARVATGAGLRAAAAAPATARPRCSRTRCGSWTPRPA